MKNIFAGMLVVMTTALFGCGGGGPSNSSSNSTPGTPGSGVGTPVATPPPTISNGGAVAYPVISAVTDTSLAAKTVAVAIPAYGYGQFTLHDDATATTPATMTYTSFATTGPATGANAGSWKVQDGRIYLTLADNSDVTLTPLAGDVINNAIVCKSHTPVDTAAGSLNSSGGARIFMASDPAAGLAQAGAYFTVASAKLPVLSTLLTQTVVTDELFIGREMYLSVAAAGYEKIKFNADHTCNFSVQSKEAVATQELSETLSGTWSTSGIALTIHGQNSYPNGTKTTKDGMATTVLTFYSVNSYVSAPSFAWEAEMADHTGRSSAAIFFDDLNALSQAASFYKAYKL